MKDWYCKPASYEEAVEIVERAVANGAKKYEWPSRKESEIELEYRWSICDGWGCFSGRTYTADYHQDEKFDRVEKLFIQQVRERFPLPSDNKEWDGEGLPPIGTVCVIECKAPHHHFASHVGKEVEIINHTEGLAVYKIEVSDGIEFHGLAAEMFKPIKSPREKWIEAAVNRGIYESDAVKLYDAMISGDIPIPEVE